MLNSKQIHFFATRSDLEPGLRRTEAELKIKYARCGLLYGPIFEQRLSLLEWDGLGKNTTGDHMSGPCFLIVERDTELRLESIPQRREGQDTIPFKAASSSESEFTQSNAAKGTERLVSDIRYDLSQKLNPDSIIFRPGGIYDGERVVVCGHIATLSKSPIAADLYKRFVGSITRAFEKIGSYRVGPEASQLMDEGYRMVTISVGSPTEYDLRRR
jgi:hypothetical protein